MNVRNKLVQLLYGEADGDSSFRRLLDGQPQLKRDLEEMQQARRLMDARKRPRPDPEVLDRIQSAARVAALRRLRRPVIRSLFSARYWLGAAAAVVIAFGGTLWFQHHSGAEEGAGADSVLAWDEEDDLQSIYWRIRALKEHNDGLLWDEGGIPLEMVPLDDPAAGSVPRHEAVHQW